MNRINEITPGPLKSLEAVLRKWQSFQKLEWWDCKGDAPWWYNERASLSLFAGAVWRSGGWVFEEFSTKRRVAKGRSKYKSSSGRCDIMFGIGKKQFIGEAKQCWPVLGSSLQTPIKEVNSCLKTALAQVSQLSSDEAERVAIVFVTPRIHASKQEDVEMIVGEFVDGLKTKHGAMASLFPKNGDKIKYRKYIYPGIILLIKSKIK
jgi:hypothetical protein